VVEGWGWVEQFQKAKLFTTRYRFRKVWVAFILYTMELLMVFTVSRKLLVDRFHLKFRTLMSLHKDPSLPTRNTNIFQRFRRTQNCETGHLAFHRM
jgi:hypothetical protein